MKCFTLQRNSSVQSICQEWKVFHAYVLLGRCSGGLRISFISEATSSLIAKLYLFMNVLHFRCFKWIETGLKNDESFTGEQFTFIDLGFDTFHRTEQRQCLLVLVVVKEAQKGCPSELHIKGDAETKVMTRNLCSP